MTTANVVDVSEWQPTSIDWANLKTNGVKAVVVRIGHGTTRDTNAADHIANATKAGLIVHVYHYYEGVDGELQYSVNNAKSLNIKPNVYYFLDMEGTIAGSWPSIFESYRKAWAGYGWNTGLYCSLSNYAKFDDATLVKQGVYRWIAAWGSDQPASADMWQYDSKTGLGSYTSALDKDVDIAGKLIKEPDSTVAEPTDPNGNYTVKPGAFVGFDHSTTELQGGEMLVASPDGQNKIPKLAPTGAFLFNNADGDNMWTLIKPKVSTIKGEKGDKGDTGADGKSAYEVAVANGYSGTQAQWLASLKGADGKAGKDGVAGKDGQTWQPYIADDKHWHIRLINSVDMPAVVGAITQGDANDLTMDDNYRIDGTVANVPSTSGLLTIRANSGEVWQTYIDSATADCYTRTRHNGTWTAWRLTTQWN
ncbi:GH25 family lysozyme [Limosilactobacillus mucosae]|uniref:GH25 family lysozyme n=1 Tax=Limosilactobacillus mucosae TaxID=97478 RepID=UPI00233E75C6|nr:GH25 family lysozyme [Limosilactobacillus mucosae]MDC2839628.1 GH25 family lysozyme [Limosilactobacillus mucosae]